MLYVTPDYGIIIYMKTCVMCKTEKELSKFNRDGSRRDGFSNKCKDCERIYRRIKRERNPEGYREHDRRYYSLHKDEIKRKRKSYGQSNVLKTRARWSLKQAVYAGLIKRGVCVVCGKLETDAHHKDYSKPYDVVWLCRKHHMRVEHRRDG